VIRKATLSDMKTVHRIISEQAEYGHILPRALVELYTQVRDFSVVTDNDQHDIVACGALQVIWEDLAEIRSLAVRPDHQGRGIGSNLAEVLLGEARDMEIAQVFVLTYRPRLFERLGFEQMEKSQLPHKIWADCIRCTKFPECDEIALVRNA
jgi:amino-acid N-acetyltransferase